MEIENVIDTTRAILPCAHNRGTSYDYQARIWLCRLCGREVRQVTEGVFEERETS